MELSNRTVLITGGSSGIGLGMAEAFKAANSTVIVCGRNNKKLRAIKEKFSEITAFPCDVGYAEQRKKLAAEVLHSFPWARHPC